ncbi:MAG: hypothetical protein FJ304_26460 [Planctomycetes bacterium]|nr:hypothetical protein [Planctomycetota bacterium]
MRVLFVLGIALALAPAARADKIGPPESYQTYSADKKFVFVMIAPGGGMFDVYTRSGLYKNDTTTEPLWTVDWYARSVAVANDGAHVVRYAGPHGYAEARNPDRAKRVVTDADLKKEALSVYAKGKLVKTFAIGDFVTDAKALPHTVTFFRWHKLARLDDDKARLIVDTLDDTRAVVELATGKIVETKKTP